MMAVKNAATTEAQSMPPFGFSAFDKGATSQSVILRVSSQSGCLGESAQ